MRSKEGVPLLLFMALLFLHFHHLHATSAPGRVDNEGERGGVIAGLNKFSHRGIGGGGNGNEGSHSPHVQGGGGGMTPLYAAAAGGGNNNHHPHHGGGDRVGAGVEALAVAIFAWFLLSNNNQDL